MAHVGDLLDHHGGLERVVPCSYVEIGVVGRTHAATGSSSTHIQGCRVRFIERVSQEVSHGKLG